MEREDAVIRRWAAAVGLRIAAVLCKNEITVTIYCVQPRLFRKKISVHFNN